MYTTDVSRFSQGQFLISAAAPAQFPPDRGAEVAFAGRSNAGKSSAINAITHRQGLARTSKTPGRTRLLNFFEVGPEQRIVDLPGYGYASGPARDQQLWASLIEALRNRESLRGWFVIVDCRRGLLDGDRTLLEWATPGSPVHILLSKADKLTRSEAARVLRTTSEELADRGTVQLFSAASRMGVEDARGILEEWLIKEPR